VEVSLGQNCYLNVLVNQPVYTGEKSKVFSIKGLHNDKKKITTIMQRRKEIAIASEQNTSPLSKLCKKKRNHANI